MSIFSKIFLAISTFIANLWGTTKTEWSKLSPEIQADFTKVITVGNMIKGYVLDPGSLPDGVGLLLTAAEAAIGPVYMGLINAALNEALIDAGLITEALTDPLAAWQALITHLKTFAPGTVGAQIGVWVEAIVGKIVSELNNNQIKVIIAFVYDTFFKVVTPAVTSPELQQVATNLGNQAAASATPTAIEPEPIVAPAESPNVSASGGN